MDAFESVVSEILWRDGYWVQNPVRVELTKQEKVTIGRPTSPRWELDIVGYSGRKNELLVVECKSYLNSPGVAYKAVDGSDAKYANRFKLFNEQTVRQVVLERLRIQMHEAGLIAERPQTRLALVCGKIASDQDRLLLQRHFKSKGWLLWDDQWLKEKLTAISESAYENSPVAVVSKLLAHG